MTNAIPVRQDDHPAISTGRVGVLLVNLGTPDAPEPAAVKRYLREFLSDRRVVEIPSLVWQPILRGIILNTRPRKSAHAYSQVWTAQGSPLAVHTRATAQALGERLGEEGILIDWAMRYGTPSIADRLTAMKEAGCQRILFAPLYPQYSGATTASANDALFEALSAMRWQPAIRIAPPYHDDPAYIAALAETARRHLASAHPTPEALLLSFHGMPERTLHLGDPYHCQCVKTARLVAEALRPDFPGPVEIGFQSRFGRAKWLEPSTENKLKEMAQKGVTNLAIMAPGFAADCLETLEEIAIRGKGIFLANSGENFTYIPCLNATDGAISFYEGLVRRELSGWI